MRVKLMEKTEISSNVRPQHIFSQHSQIMLKNNNQPQPQRVILNNFISRWAPSRYQVQIIICPIKVNLL